MSADQGALEIKRRRIAELEEENTRLRDALRTVRDESDDSWARSWAAEALETKA